MLDVVTSVAIVLGIAWFGRMLLGAREVTWGWLGMFMVMTLLFRVLLAVLHSENSPSR